MIYDFHNGSQSTNVWAVGEEHDAANLDQPPLRGLDVDFCHSGDVSFRSVVSLCCDILDQKRFAEHLQSKVVAEDLLWKIASAAVFLTMFKFRGRSRLNWS